MRLSWKGGWRGCGRVMVVGLTVVGVVGAAPVAGAAPPVPGAGPDRQFGVEVLSTRADAVTGGDVLVEIVVPRTVPLHQVRVSVDGRDVTDAFRTGVQPRTLVGLVDELVVGANTLQVSAEGWGKGRPSTTLELINHPTTGPVFSGPHQTPFICQTDDFTVPVIGESLGPALDEDCSAPTRVDYVYRSTSGGFKPLPDQSVRPEDMAQTTTTAGDTVDYVVRVETGTINRAIYQIAFLHPPGTPLPDPWTDTKAWNNRLVYTFGGGCNAGYRQGPQTGAVLEGNIHSEYAAENLIARGFAVASSSQNVFGNNCNDVISAETAMMVKEHFIEQFGSDRYTIGTGGSGGSMQVHLIAQNYPGILDGIVPSVSYSDIFTIIPPVVDCSLLANAFKLSDTPWAIEQNGAVAGFAGWDNCESPLKRGTLMWMDPIGFSPGWIQPGVRPPGRIAAQCDPVVPAELVYDPDTNPGGIRCTIHDNTVNVFGRDPTTGFARRPFDNVGVQYGLSAFSQGAISFEQFAELNELVGGYDADGNIVKHRMVADPSALKIAYRTGRVNSGMGGLSAVPIIDFRRYQDRNPDIHDRVRSFATRARLTAANGHAGNHVILTHSPVGTGAGSGEAVATAAFDLMDRWLSDIAEDTSPEPLAEKVLSNRPVDAVDTCWTPDGDKVVEPATFDGPGVCNELYPSHGDPRIAAGGPLSGDVLKCQLKAVDTSNYTQPLTANQLERLRTIFPAGVCDYSRPGIGQQPLAGTWLSY